MEVFTTTGDELSFTNATDLLEQLSRIDSSVPGRTKRRRSHHKERFDIVQYLIALAQASLLAYPLRVVKSEAPDFLLQLPDGTVVGLEITEAGTERHQRALTELEKSPPGTMLEGEADLRKPGEPLRGSPSYGDEAARELSGLIVLALERKVSTLNEPHFQSADRYDILIHDNSHCSSPMRMLRPVLREVLAKWPGHNRTARFFSVVSVIRDFQLIYDCTGRNLLLQAPEPSYEDIALE